MDLIFLLKIGFLPISFWDLLDVLIVGYLFYILYNLSRGTLAFNIVIGVIVLVVVYWIVRELGMSLLSSILGGLVDYGFIFIVVMFQPEIRRFLILFGRNFLKGRSNLLRQIFGDTISQQTTLSEQMINKIVTVTEKLAFTKTGALIVFTQNPSLQGFDNSGVKLDARISTRLIESIFQKESPLHDGAMIISDGKIFSVGSILPISNSRKLPKNAGLRHRAGVGISETTDAFAIIVSEETGKISTAKEGKLTRIKNKNELYQQLKNAMGNSESVDKE
jgi:uncharacterized protein (TIGR00159 family)